MKRLDKKNRKRAVRFVRRSLTRARGDHRRWELAAKHGWVHSPALFEWMISSEALLEWMAEKSEGHDG